MHGIPSIQSGLIPELKGLPLEEGLSQLSSYVDFADMDRIFRGMIYDIAIFKTALADTDDARRDAAAEVRALLHFQNVIVGLHEQRTQEHNG